MAHIDELVPSGKRSVAGALFADTTKHCFAAVPGRFGRADTTKEMA
jgi:hypothetical protein